MSEDVADRLRSLAREYSQGRLSLEVYRQKRTRLLDSLQSPQSAAVRPSPSAPTVPNAPLAPSWVGWVGLFILGVMVVGALCSVLLGDRFREQPDRGRAMNESRHVGQAGSDRIFALVAPLLKDPNWTEARIAAVNAALLEEGTRRIAAERQTEWFQRFVQEVRQRLEEQRALRADGGSSLEALAVTIGIDLNAPRVPPHPPAGKSARTERSPQLRE